MISTIDLTKSYWAIPLEKESQHLVSFKTHIAQYCFKLMPFGLWNAEATFQKEMNRALSNYQDFARAYIDDLAISSETWNEHLLHLDTNFKKLLDLGFSVNLKKCSFARKYIKYLRHIIGSGNNRTDPEKGAAIQKLVRLQTKKQLKCLLGLFNYYRDYIPHHAEVVYPLTELTKKRCPKQISWIDEHQRAFDNLKQNLVEAPSLHAPVLGQTFVIHCDASSIGNGARLSQMRDGICYPISYANQKLTKVQQAWPTVEREAYAAV